MEIKKYAAIDIGSNGIRLLINNVILKKGELPIFQKASLIRVPIRLGTDSFTEKKIEAATIAKIIKAMLAFKLLIQIHQVEAYRACATSALREASNSEEVVAAVKKESGVHIDIIDGTTEAAIIASTDLYDLLDVHKNYLYVDVGGGSTEFTFFSKGKSLESQSYKIGTVRFFDDPQKFFETLKTAQKWVKKTAQKYPHCTVVGSGGNINKIFKLSESKKGKPLKIKYLEMQYKKLKAMSFDQRIRKMELNPYRADVIIPALKIYISAMKWCGAEKIIVPKIGLADGIIKTLYLENT